MLRNFASFFIAAGLTCVTPTLLSAGEFSKSNDTVGYANAFGNLKFNGHLGAIELSRAEIYNFYFQYSSYSEYESPFLGKGFFVPLLEASLIDHDYFLEATTMGGVKIYMYRLPAEPNRFVSLNGKNSATKLQGEKFVRETEDGFKFEYDEGRLERLQTPKGTQLVFEYDGELCKTIRSSTGVVVCSINKIANDAKSSFKTARGKYELEFQVFPSAGDSSKLPPSYTLNTIAWPDGAETQFSYSYLDDTGNIKMQMRYQDDVMDFIWNKDTDLLVSADRVDYEITPLQRANPTSKTRRAERVVTGVYTIRQQFEDGSWELFSHDEDAGYSDVEKSNGEIIRTHYINTRGPIYNLVSKRERIRKVSEVQHIAEVYYEAFYDAKGNLLRQVRDGKITWHLRKGGIPESVVKDKDNLVRYDEKDRVIESRFDDSLTRIQWLKNDSSRVVSSHPWGEVNLRYYDPFGNPKPIPAADKFVEKNSF